MITIGIELNHVVRNINKQILKYYSKDIQELDLDKIDVFDNVDKVCKFPSKYAKNQFEYIDYAYEIFGCGPQAERELMRDITNWMGEIENIEDEDIRLYFYSLNEGAISIQSTLFYLSKRGARARKVFFPKKLEEIWEECDVVITANNDVINSKIPNDKILVKINRTLNKDSKKNVDFIYNNLSNVIQDKNFFDKIRKLIKEKRNDTTTKNSNVLIKLKNLIKF